MKLLLDSQLLVWSASAPERRSREASQLIEDRDNELWFSAASIWELALKSSQRRRNFRMDPAGLRDALLGSGYLELAVSGRHAIAIGTLPWLHRDPFDRILIAQATVEAMLLVTADAVLARYPGPVRQV